LDAQISAVLKEDTANPAEFDEQFAPYVELIGELHRVLERESPHLSTRTQAQHLNKLREHVRKQPLHRGFDWSFLSRSTLRWAAAAVLVIFALILIARASSLLQDLVIAAGGLVPTPTETPQPTTTPKVVETSPAVLPTGQATATPTPSATPQPSSTLTPPVTLPATSTLAPTFTLGSSSPTPGAPAETPEVYDTAAPSPETPNSTEPDPGASPAPEDSEQETTEPEDEETPEPEDEETTEPKDEETPEPEDEETAKPQDGETPDTREEETPEPEEEKTPESQEEETPEPEAEEGSEHETKTENETSGIAKPVEGHHLVEQPRRSI
jgi:hypothetical protein